MFKGLWESGIIFKKAFYKNLTFENEMNKIV